MDAYLSTTLWICSMSRRSGAIEEARFERKCFERDIVLFAFIRNDCCADW